MKDENWWIFVLRGTKGEFFVVFHQRAHRRRDLLYFSMKEGIENEIIVGFLVNMVKAKMYVGFSSKLHIDKVFFFFVNFLPRKQKCL